MNIVKMVRMSCFAHIVGGISEGNAMILMMIERGDDGGCDDDDGTV